MSDSGVIEYSDGHPARKTESLVTTPNRILVLGSHLSGAKVLSEAFQQFLEDNGVKNPQVEYARYTEDIKPGFFNDTPSEDNPNPEKSLPKGVILLPQMRQYDPSGTSMSIESYGSPGFDDHTVADYVRELCEKYNVPLVEIHENYSPEQIDSEIVKMLAAGDKKSS